ncbi:ATP-binding protein [Streptomyces sp. NPDC059743]|uniref:SCO6881 family protein n=1 Tax=Streptomyces sp. NPDC059743 TaxID=3346928 RepID=UPI0036518D67
MDVCDPPLMGSVCDTVDFVTNPGGAVTDGIGAWIAKSMGEVAATAADLAANAVNTTTAIDLNASWFRANYELLLPIGLAITVGTFCLQLMTAAWRRDERALAQAALGTMTGILFSFCAIAFTTVALTVVDALSAGLFQAANSSVDDAIRRVISVNELGAMYGLGWGVPAFVALGCAIGAFLYWGVMVARKVGVLILVALAVFAGAGGGWEAAKRWRRGWIEATATLVVSKLLMTVVFLIGVSAMGKSDPQDGMAALSDALAGIVVMILVLLCPYATYRFVRWASDSGGQDDLHRTGIAGLAVTAGAVKRQRLRVIGRTSARAAALSVAAGRDPRTCSYQGVHHAAPQQHARLLHLRVRASRTGLDPARRDRSSHRPPSPRHVRAARTGIRSVRPRRDGPSPGRLHPRRVHRGVRAHRR